MRSWRMKLNLRSRLCVEIPCCIARDPVPHLDETLPVSIKLHLRTLVGYRDGNVVRDHHSLPLSEDSSFRQRLSHLQRDLDNITDREDPWKARLHCEAIDSDPSSLVRQAGLNGESRHTMGCHEGQEIVLRGSPI